MLLAELITGVRAIKRFNPKILMFCGCCLTTNNKMVNCIGWSIVFIESSKKGHIEYSYFQRINVVIQSKKMKDLALRKYLFGV